MDKSITDNNKKRGRGRPRVDSTFVGVRLPPQNLAELDEWIAEQPQKLSRPEAIRLLVHSCIKLTKTANPADWENDKFPYKDND